MVQEFNGGWVEGIYLDDCENYFVNYVDCFEWCELFGMDYCLCLLSGEYCWLSSQVVLYFGLEGEFLGFIGICIDIIECWVVEDLLIEVKVFVNGIIDVIFVYLCVFDMNGRILVVNQVWFDFFDWNYLVLEKLNYFIGINYFDICEVGLVFFLGDMQVMVVGICQVIVGEIGKFFYEYFCYSLDEQCWFIVMVSCFYGDSGNVVVVYKNVIEFKKVEDVVMFVWVEVEQVNNVKLCFFVVVSYDFW